MLLADTSKMDDAEKARRAKALSRMETMLFPEGDSGIFIIYLLVRVRAFNFIRFSY